MAPRILHGRGWSALSCILIRCIITYLFDINSVDTLNEHFHSIVFSHPLFILYKPSTYSSFKCTCIFSTELAPDPCLKPCPLGYQIDDNGQELCECIPPNEQCPRLSNCTKLDCIYGYRRDTNGCPKCKCRRCPQMHCSKRCPLGYVYNDQGCKICKCRGKIWFDLIWIYFNPFAYGLRFLNDFSFVSILSFR